MLKYIEFEQKYENANLSKKLIGYYKKSEERNLKIYKIIINSIKTENELEAELEKFY